MKEDSSKAKKGFSLVDNAITDIKIPGKRANKAGFVQLPNLLLYCQADIGLTPTTFTALAYLISHAYDINKYSFPSIQNSLAPDLGRNRTSVDKWVKELQTIDVAAAMRKQATELEKLQEKIEFEEDRFIHRIDALKKAAIQVEKQKLKGLIEKVSQNKNKRGRANAYKFDKLHQVLSILAAEFDKKAKI